MTASVFPSAVVTGGTSGIGLAVARQLLAAGYHVYLWARNAGRGQAVADQLNRAGTPGRAIFHVCDVASAESVRAALRSFESSHDRLNILVNAAGILQRTPLGESSVEAIGQQIDIVLKGTILTSSLLAVNLARSGQGVLVNIGSVAGRLSFSGLGVYGAAKAGVIHFTRTCAQELFASGVRVFCVCPGVVETSLMSKEDYACLLPTTPGRRLQTADEVARLIVALTRPDYPSLTGAVIDLDDGVSLFPGGRPTPLAAARVAPAASAPPTLATPRTAAPAVTTLPDTVSTPGTNGLLPRVAEVFQRTFGVPAEMVQPNLGPEEVARWDSLGNLRLIAAIEAEFGCALDVNEIMDMTDVAGILKTLKGKLS